MGTVKATQVALLLHAITCGTLLDFSLLGRASFLSIVRRGKKERLAVH